MAVPSGSNNKNAGTYLWMLLHEDITWSKVFCFVNDNILECYEDESCSKVLTVFSLGASTNLSIIDSIKNRKNVIQLENLILGSSKEILHLSPDVHSESSMVATLSETISGNVRSICNFTFWSNEFQPSCFMYAKYQSVSLIGTRNLTVLPPLIESKPIIQITNRIAAHNDSNIYALIMVNADHMLASDDHNNPTRTMYLQWAVVNIVAEDVTQGNEIVHYQTVSPLHNMDVSRCAFILLRQKGMLSSTECASLATVNRVRFSISDWAARLGASSPDAICTFQVSKSPSTSTGANIGTNTSSVVDGNNSPLSISPPLSPLKIVNFTPGTPESTSKSSAPRSVLKKSSPRPSGSSSPAKKLVSFMIVHPTLMSDSQLVSPSFYEGHEDELPPRGFAAHRLMESEEEDALADIPDYQVNYESSGSESSSLHSMSISSHSILSSSRGLGGDDEINHPDVIGGLSIATEGLTISAIDAHKGGQLSPTTNNTCLNSLNPLGRKLSHQTSDSSVCSGSGTNRSSVPLMQRVAAVQKIEDYCSVFGVSTVSIFQGEMMRKKFTRDFVMKESFVWIEPASKSIHWARSATQKNVKHKHILLDKNGSYSLIGPDGQSMKEPSSPVLNNGHKQSNGVNTATDGASNAAVGEYKKTAGGVLAGVIKGAELEDLTISITTEDNLRLKIKIPAHGSFATLRAKEWFKVIKLLTQDTAK